MRYIDAHDGLYLPMGRKPIHPMSTDWVRRRIASGGETWLVVDDANDPTTIAYLMGWCEVEFGRILPIISKTMNDAEMAKACRGTTASVDEALFLWAIDEARRCSLATCKVLPATSSPTAGAEDRGPRQFFGA